MASTRTNQTKANKSGRTQSKKGQSRKKKNSSDDTMKFLLVLVIAGIAIAMIFFMQPDENEAGNVLKGTPTPTVAADNLTPEPTAAGTVQTPEPTKAQENTLKSASHSGAILRLNRVKQYAQA